ncbi:hypothetical protein AZE42_02463 [Rhizopogon vesiculosus]|uniref:Uncharacterized protein n=1 Tax=Rhizopogon vesiculosus TaxID=180088 RepID=A0A1J8Q483_9AGAM|nr:hypothetical protein AZE42_02463 [Rhizopogon vesiculosus]
MNIIIRLVSFALLLTVFLLFLLVGLSLTIIKSIIIIEVSAVNSVDPVSNAVTKLQFGVWGVSTIIALVVAVITAVLSTVVFAVDVALVVAVKNNIHSLFSGGDFVVSFGNGAWMSLVAMILTWLLVIMLSAQRYYFCGVRRPKPESNTSEEDSIEKVTI